MIEYLNDAFSIGLLKDFFQIIFFIVMSIVGVLTYLQAKKTLFSPIKTEVFKLQIEELKLVLSLFNKRNIINFDDYFDIEKIFKLNALEMQYSYVKLFFKDKVSATEEMLDYLKQESCGMLVDKNSASKFFEKISADVELENRVEHLNEKLEPAITLAKWNSFVMPGVKFTKKFQNSMSELDLFIASPLLPDDLIKLIEEFQSTMLDNLQCIKKTIQTASKEMPQRYSTPDAVIKFNPAWIWNEFNDGRKDVDSISKNILRYINEHLKITELMK